MDIKRIITLKINNAKNSLIIGIGFLAFTFTGISIEILSAILVIGYINYLYLSKTTPEEPLLAGIVNIALSAIIFMAGLQEFSYNMALLGYIYIFIGVIYLHFR